MVEEKQARTLQERLGSNISRFRKQRGWTQAMLAERMGLEPESISRFERGATLPSLATLEGLATLLETTIADLLAECPGTAYPEVQRLATLLDRVPSALRPGLVSVIENLCRLLESTPTTTNTSEHSQI